jgi:hypothetical protein
LTSAPSLTTEQVWGVNRLTRGFGSRRLTTGGRIFQAPRGAFNREKPVDVGNVGFIPLIRTYVVSAMMPPRRARRGILAGAEEAPP